MVPEGVRGWCENFWGGVCPDTEFGFFSSGGEGTTVSRAYPSGESVDLIGLRLEARTISSCPTWGVRQVNVFLQTRPPRFPVTITLHILSALYM